jgi:hypothetical protein
VLNNLRSVLLFTIFVAIAAPAASQSTLQLRGSWGATAGTRIFQGTWTATLSPSKPNLAEGSWTVIGANRVVLQGTWAAEKQRAGWRGAWSALVASAPAGSPPMTGTWQANVKESALQTLADMLQRTAEGQVDGTWSHAGMSGTWSLVR